MAGIVPVTAGAGVTPPAPVAVAPTYGTQAAAALDPIFAATNAQQTGQYDALNSALQNASDASTSRLTGLASAMGAPSAALKQVNSIPLAGIQNFQTRALGANQAQQSALSGLQAAAVPGMAADLQSQDFATRLAAQAAADKVAAENATAANAGQMTPYEAAEIALNTAKATTLSPDQQATIANTTSMDSATEQAKQAAAFGQAQLAYNTLTNNNTAAHNPGGGGAYAQALQTISDAEGPTVAAQIAELYGLNAGGGVVGGAAASPKTGILGALANIGSGQSVLRNGGPLDPIHDLGDLFGQNWGHTGGNQNPVKVPSSKSNP